MTDTDPVCAPFEAIGDAAPLTLATRHLDNSPDQLAEWIEILADSVPIALLPRQAFLDAVHSMAHDMADAVVTR